MAAERYPRKSARLRQFTIGTTDLQSHHGFDLLSPHGSGQYPAGGALVAVEQGMHFTDRVAKPRACERKVLAFAIYLVLVIALPVALSSLIGYRSLPRGNACPHCAQATLPLLSQSIRLARCVSKNFSLQRRWCPTCEWDGYTRATTVSSIPLRVADSVLRQRQEVRTIEIGGRPWSVMLESWQERGRFFGRLIFVGPSGKLWCDSLPAFNGPTKHDVLGQALALSDRLLAYRLRDVISG